MKDKLTFKYMPEELAHKLSYVVKEDDLISLDFKPALRLTDLGFSYYGAHWNSNLWYKIEDENVYTVAMWDFGNTYCSLFSIDVFSKRIMKFIKGNKRKHRYILDPIYDLIYKVK